MAEDPQDPIDLGTIRAHPVGSPSAEPAGAPASAPSGPGAEEFVLGDAVEPVAASGLTPYRDRSLDTLLGGIRRGTGQMWKDIYAAHKGPKANTRTVPDWVRSLAWLLDDAIPIGGGRRVGIDGVMSFVPGIGDAAGLAAGMVVVLAGIGAGVSMPTMALMMLNLGIEGVVGAIPFAGAVFDMAYKANNRNLRLIERDLADRAGTRRSSLKVLVLSVVAVFLWMLLLVVVTLGSLYLFWRFLNRIF